MRLRACAPHVFTAFAGRRCTSRAKHRLRTSCACLRGTVCVLRVGGTVYRVLQLCFGCLYKVCVLRVRGHRLRTSFVPFTGGSGTVTTVPLLRMHLSAVTGRHTNGAQVPRIICDFSWCRCGGYTRPFVYRPGDIVPYRQYPCTQHQSRAHLISNEPPRGKPGQNSMPTSADTRTYDRVHRHTAMAPPQVQGARTLGWLRVRGTFGIGGAPRGARASPRLTRRRARPATLRSPLALPQPIVVVRGSAGR